MGYTGGRAPTEIENEIRSTDGRDQWSKTHPGAEMEKMTLLGIQPQPKLLRVANFTTSAWPGMHWASLGITGHHWAYGAQNRPDPECQRVVTLALMEAAAKGSSKVKGSLPEMLLGPARISSSYSRTVPSHILSDTIYLSIYPSIYLSIYLSIYNYLWSIYLFIYFEFHLQPGILVKSNN